MFSQVIELIDQANSQDPNQEEFTGKVGRKSCCILSV
ncbi:DUF4202 domain-containing protein [Motilimonas sp. 1_MG-2023]|nr:MULTISPECIES: DUF4202 domain-containing protein [unclassified Motilimonas]MDO6524340.1 DUF4202 domain-containing protein [Motilimonas sp. 1_MG-2023]